MGIYGDRLPLDYIATPTARLLELLWNHMDVSSSQLLSLSCEKTVIVNKVNKTQSQFDLEMAQNKTFN